MAGRTRGVAIDVVSLVGIEPLCDAPAVEGLTPEQVNALHVFKHEILAAGYRLYMAVPQPMVDPLLDAFLQKIAKKLEKIQGPPAS